jgi:hypothetical protein
LKTTDVSRYGGLLAAGLLLFAAAACEEEKKPDDTTGADPTKIKVEQIIVQPKVASPLDTVLFTAVVTSSSQNVGDVPAMDWTASGGEFVEDDELTVRWVAPPTPGLFTVTATATNAANSSTGSADVFVGGSETLITANGGEVHLLDSGDCNVDTTACFYFLFTTDVSRGVDVYSYVEPAYGDAVLPVRANNLTVSYSPDGVFEVHAADSLVAGLNRPRHVYVGNFATGQIRGLTRDRADPASFKHHVFSYPTISPNSELVAYQGWLQDPLGVSPDSFHVFVYDLVLSKTVKVTAEHTFPRNFFPTFSTDGQWLTYVSDQGGGQWELYGSPVNGNVVDGSLASLTRLTDTGGAIVSGQPTAVKNPLKAWNPVLPILAILAADGTLYLVETHSAGADVTDVPGAAGVAELVWSPLGTQLAASLGAEIVTITPGGAVTSRVTGVDGDLLRDIVWSPDEEWLVYRVTRATSTWFELLDLDAGALTAPLPVTSVAPVGQLPVYRGSMSMSPAWTEGNRIIAPVFGIGSVDTPGVISVDLSGLAN